MPELPMRCPTEGGMSRPKLGELLIDAGVVDEMQLQAALGEQNNWGQRLGQTLLQMGVLDEETLVRTLARQLAIPVVWLRGKRIKPEVVELLKDDFIQKHRVLPVLMDQRGRRTLILAMEDPCNIDVIDTVRRETGVEVKPALAAPSELDDAIGRHVVSDLGDSLHGASFAVEEDSGPDLVQMQQETTPMATPEPAQDEAAPSNAVVLRALTQLLVEKGVFSREELIQRLSALRDEPEK
jgi:type IV pilus assembly protein PilB